MNTLLVCFILVLLIIDFVIKDTSLDIKEVEVDYSFATDHFPITFLLHLNAKLIDKTETIFIRQYHKFDVNNFIKDLSSSGINTPSVFNHPSCTQTVKLYNKTISALYDFHCPVKEKTISCNSTKPK